MNELFNFSLRYVFLKFEIKNSSSNVNYKYFLFIYCYLLLFSNVLSFSSFLFSLFLYNFKYFFFLIILHPPRYRINLFQCIYTIFNVISNNNLYFFLYVIYNYVLFSSSMICFIFRYILYIYYILIFKYTYTQSNYSNIDYFLKFC